MSMMSDGSKGVDNSNCKGAPGSVKRLACVEKNQKEFDKKEKEDREEEERKEEERKKLEGEEDDEDGEDALKFEDIDKSDGYSLEEMDLLFKNKEKNKDNSLLYNYCPHGYGMTGIKTSAWSNVVNEYAKKCKQRYMRSPRCWTHRVARHGTQILRKYSMKCCPTLPEENIIKDEKLDNLDDYKYYDSIRNYPFHIP
jgi:hypothetical protein